VPTAKRVVLWRVRHDARTFVEKVDFLTARGNVDAVVTNLGVLKMRDGFLRLANFHPGICPEVIRKNTGFDLDTTGAAETPAPTKAEMTALKKIDPRGFRYLEAGV
jgi:glutaconate CoA-transferase subunit B